MKNNRPSLDSWKIIKKNIIVKDKYLHLWRYSTINPLGKKGYYWVAKRNHDFAIVIPLLDKKTTLLVGQFRPPVEKVVWEFPMGAVEKEKDISKVAATELEEETGFRAKNLVKLGQFYPASGLLSQQAHVYLASQLTFVGPHPEGNEYLETKKVALKEIRKMIVNGEIEDAISIAAYYLFWAKND